MLTTTLQQYDGILGEMLELRIEMVENLNFCGRTCKIHQIDGKKDGGKELSYK